VQRLVQWLTDAGRAPQQLADWGCLEDFDDEEAAGEEAEESAGGTALGREGGAAPGGEVSPARNRKSEPSCTA
jgi:hypothetical protein